MTALVSLVNLYLIISDYTFSVPRSERNEITPIRITSSKERQSDKDYCCDREFYVDKDLSTYSTTDPVDGTAWAKFELGEIIHIDKVNIVIYFLYVIIMNILSNHKTKQSYNYITALTKAFT